MELRVTKSVQDTLRSEFSSLRTELAALNAKIESSGTALNAKIESSGIALANNFRQTMKDREVRIPRCDTVAAWCYTSFPCAPCRGASL